MTQKNRTRKWRVVTSIVTALFMLTAVLVTFTGCAPPEEPIARSYETKCYATNGGDKWVCADGGEMEFQSGSTLDIQATTIMTIGGDVDIIGDLAVAGASDFGGNITSVTGCITIADCLNTTGAVDFDTTLNVDGAVDFNSTLDLDGELSSGTGDVQINDDVYITGTLDTTGDATFGADVTVTDDLDVTDDLTVGGDLYVTGHTWITTTTRITGDTFIVGDLSVTENVTVTENLDVSGDADFNANVDIDGELSSGTGDLQIADDVWITGTLDASGAVDFASTLNVDGNISSNTGCVTVTDCFDVNGDVTLGDDITDLVRVQSAVRTYDGTDYIQDITVSDVPGTANNGWQIAYNLTDWDGETAFTALMAEAKIVSPTVISGCTAYGADFMVRLEGLSGGSVIHEATASTGIGMYAEVQAVYTSSWPTAYAVYGELEAASGSIITDSSVFYADLVGSGEFGTVDVMSVRGDTWDYGIDFNDATAMTADFRLHNGETIDNATDGVIQMTSNVTVTGALTVVDNVDIGGTLELEDETFSGPIKFGVASGVVTNTSIAHGFATTPTSVVLTAGCCVTEPYGISVSAITATNFVVCVAPVVGVVCETFYWFAGLAHP